MKSSHTSRRHAGGRGRVDEARACAWGRHGRRGPGNGGSGARERQVGDGGQVDAAVLASVRGLLGLAAAPHHPHLAPLNHSIAKRLRRSLQVRDFAEGVELVGRVGLGICTHASAKKKSGAAHARNIL